MQELKKLSAGAVERAMQKAERYRFLGEPCEAESIYLDILALDGDQHEAGVRRAVGHVAAQPAHDRVTGGRRRSGARAVPVGHGQSVEDQVHGGIEDPVQVARRHHLQTGVRL